jgi:hypothetical protein
VNEPERDDDVEWPEPQDDPDDEPSEPWARPDAPVTPDEPES